MRHRRKGRKLGRVKAQREALLKSLAESLILHEAITTTHAKAKELKTVVEPLITYARRPAEKRKDGFLMSKLYTGKAVKKLISDIAPRYTKRPGGYTRITKLGTYRNDGAENVRIELV